MLPLALLLLAADPDAARLDRIAPAVEAAIAANECPGAVVVVVQADRVVYRRAFGQRTAATPMTPDTVFDLASLTKPVATAASVMRLVEQGKLRLGDPVAKHWPAFAANGKAGVTVEQCLLHTSGLIADNAIGDYAGGRDAALAKVAGLPLTAPAGTRFTYSDVGFITLGEVVARASGKPLDQFARDELFAPLKMTDTGYTPNAELAKRAAPTETRNGADMLGTVHDPRAFALGGVAGHAGLFGTADDLARFARMLLKGGELDGVRVLSPLAVKLYTDPRPVPGGANLLRSRGWDVNTGFSAPRGELFPAGDGFGHTGFTGTSIWIDPPSSTAVILLTSRLHGRGTAANVTELRRTLGTVAASAAPAAVRTTRPDTPPPVAAPAPRPPVLTGIDVLARDQFKALAGRKIGLVTNHTGRAADGTPTIDLLAKADGVKLVALFSPEHGIRGELDEKVGDTTDARTGLPVYSLYGTRTKPTAEQLQGIDTLVYDIQDIGCRFYTYISTLGLLLETAREHKLKVVVLDRPNPLGGVVVEGPVRDAGRESFVAYHPLPLRHGLTVGELATLFNRDRALGVDLTVVRCENWRRGDTFDRTGLTWRNPSPNMRHLTAALVYPGVGVLETTNVSVGRGTERPFEWVGAPWLDGRALAAELNGRGLPGVRFVPVGRTPVSSVHKGKPCGGVDLIVTDWAAVRPVPLGLHMAAALRKLHPAEWETKNLDRLLVHQATFDGLVAGRPVAELERAWRPGLERFAAGRAGVLLYGE